jgi:2-C-methyl-D-erythritol 2,4-cyclodiphosphate synthase|uniref:2-C-methyl-D-erythritol 2,4-cyclodiphosphate synthase n=1 Tax=Desulfobacca acetoxidans TaxID=60893 RepID=A0A7C3WMR2_9BACT
MAEMRVGLGYDAHRLVRGRPLILGGVEIPYHLGLSGHSDADVLSHALADALLGAVGSGDLGTHFPDTDPAFKGISSLVLLERIMTLVREKGWRPVNVDATVVAQAPRLAPHVAQMIGKLAPILGLSPDAVNIKATTTEKMGFTGREEGIAAYAVVLVEKLG